MQLINAVPLLNAVPKDEVTTQSMCASMHGFNNHPATILLLFSAVTHTIPSDPKPTVTTSDEVFVNLINAMTKDYVKTQGI